MRQGGGGADSGRKTPRGLSKDSAGSGGTPKAGPVHFFLDGPGQQESAARAEGSTGSTFTMWAFPDKYPLFWSAHRRYFVRESRYFERRKEK